MDSDGAYSTIALTQEAGIAEIALNRPDAANSLNLTMASELHDAVLRCDAAPEVRAVILTGRGRFFCAGGDLKSFVEHEADLPRFVKEVTTDLHAAISRLNRMDAPVIVAVNGVAAGAGMALMMCGDMAIAGDSASFTMAYTRAGLTPDGSSTYFLPRLVGLRRAKELALTNRTLTAAEALEWGLINRVVPAADLAGEARKLAQELAQGATLALGQAKRLLDSSFNKGLETAMEDEAQSISHIVRTDDARAGISAFVEKRRPEFRRR